MAKGQKTGGRETGTPNRLTIEIRSVLKDLLFIELQGISDRLEKLPDKDRLEVIIKLMPYVCPKLDNVRYDNGEGKKWDW